VREQFVQTPVGRARLDWFPAHGVQRATIALGHGTATGVEAGDLQALARVLPDGGIAVALMTQPYRVEHNPRAADEASLDQAWRAVWPAVIAQSDAKPVIAGGRSAGSQVACRTAGELGVAAVLILAYPLRGPGSPAELVAVTAPALVVQGGLDPFGRPTDFPPLPDTMRLVEIPETNHMFAGVRRAGSENPLDLITGAVTDWLEQVIADTYPSHFDLGT
jgi:uncharacterized protein